MNLLDDFIENSKEYNSTALAKSIESFVDRGLNYKNDSFSVVISGFDPSKSIKDVLQFCIENPQPKEKLEKAIDLMISGWERAMFMDLSDRAA